HDSNEHQQPEYQKDLAPGDARRARIAGPASGRSFVELYHAPENQKQRPPVPKQRPEIQAAIVVQQNDQANGDEHEACKGAAAARAKSSHTGLLALPGLRGLPGRWSGWRAWWHRGNWASDGSIHDMARHGCECRTEADDSDDQQNDRPGIAEVKETTAHL